MTGFMMVWGAAGSMEFGGLSPIGAFILGSLGLVLMYRPVKDGSIHRLIDKV